MQTVKIAVVGDYNPDWTHHTTVQASLEHAGKALQLLPHVTWIPTDIISESADELKNYNGIWCSSGSPYRSMHGAIASIRFARENDRAFFGT